MFTITSAIRQYLLEISASCNNVNFVKWKWNHFVIGSGRIDVYKNTTQNAPWIRGTTGSALPPQVISTGRCQRIWPTYAVIGWLTKTRTGALLWLV